MLRPVCLSIILGTCCAVWLGRGSKGAGMFTQLLVFTPTGSASTGQLVKGGLANSGLVAAFAAVATSTFAYLYGCGCDKSLRVFMGSIYGAVFALFSAYGVIVCSRGEVCPTVSP